MADPAGEADSGALRLDFDRHLTLRFHCSAITADGGLLAYRQRRCALMPGNARVSAPRHGQ